MTPRNASSGSSIIACIGARPSTYGEEHKDTLGAAYNYARTFLRRECFEEARSLLRKIVPVARRVLGEPHEYTLRMRWCYGQALYKDPAATLDALREAVTTLEETARTSRRVLGGAHPITTGIEGDLRKVRAILHAREEKPSPGSTSSS